VEFSGDGQSMSGLMPGLDKKDSLAHNSSNNTSSGNTGSGYNTGASQGNSGGPAQRADAEYAALEAKLEADTNNVLDYRGRNGAKNSSVTLADLGIYWTKTGDGTTHYSKYPGLGFFADNHPDIVKNKGGTRAIEILAKIKTR
jgi:hypothetical protein